MNLIKSDYEVFTRKECTKVRNGSKASLLLQQINVLKCCLANDVASYTRVDIERLEYLQKNRHIIRMTNLEFLLLVPYANKYQNLIDRAKGKRIIVSAEIWYSQVSATGFKKEEMTQKIDEVILAIEQNHLFEYVTINGLVTKVKVKAEL